MNSKVLTHISLQTEYRHLFKFDYYFSYKVMKHKINYYCHSLYLKSSNGLFLDIILALSRIFFCRCVFLCMDRRFDYCYVLVLDRWFRDGHGSTFLGPSESILVLNCLSKLFFLPKCFEFCKRSKFKQYPFSRRPIENSLAEMKNQIESNQSL